MSWKRDSVGLIIENTLRWLLKTMPLEEKFKLTQKGGASQKEGEKKSLLKKSRVI